MNDIDRAKAFAIERHGEQKRKWTGEPYWHHLRNVAQILVDLNCHHFVVAAAWTHDSVEDAGVTLNEIEEQFGPEVRELVFWVTDPAHPKHLNRKARKTLDRERLQIAPPSAQTIKLADLIDNTSSIVEHDKNFARIYLDEKEQLLKVLTKGDPVLIERARQTLLDGQRALVQHALGGKC